MVTRRRATFTSAFPEWNTLKEWGEANYTLPASNAVRGGQLIKLTPRQDGIAAAFDDPAVKEIVLILPAQTEGKTEIMTMASLYVADTRPANQLFCFDGDERNDRMRREKMDPVLDRNPRLASKFAKKNSKTMKNNKEGLQYIGGMLTFITAGSEGKTRNATARYIYIDELAVYPNDEVVDNLMARDSSFRSNSKIMYCSTPGSTINCKITAQYERTNMCRWWMPCPHNEGQPVDDWHWFIPGWDCVQIIWGPEVPAGRRRKALAFTFWCPVCGSAISDAERMEWTDRGEWRAENPHITESVGFQMSGFASSLRTLEMLCADYNKQTEDGFTKNVLAEPVKVVIKDELDADKLSLVIWAPPPAAVSDLRTAAIDVQANRLVYQVMDWYGGDRGYILVQGNIIRRPHIEDDDDDFGGYVEYEEWLDVERLVAVLCGEGRGVADRFPATWAAARNYGHQDHQGRVGEIRH